MRIPPKTPQSIARAAAIATSTTPSPPMSSVTSAELSGGGSRKRPPPDPTHVHHRGASQKPRPTSASAGVQDRPTSLRSSIHQSEASNKAKVCKRSPVEKSQSGQINTSPAMQPQPGLTTEVKAEIEDVAPDSIRGGNGEGPPPHTTGIRGTIDSPSIQEELRTINGARLDHKTKKEADLSNQQTCSIDANFLQQVAVAFKEVKANQEESTTLVKETISLNPSLEPTFLAIQEKHGDITKDCPLESGQMLSSVLAVICKVVQELQKKHLTDVDCNLLNSYYLVVKDAEKMKVNVNWLRARLDEIKDAVNSIVETKNLNDEKNRLAELIENEKRNLVFMKTEWENLKVEIATKESQLNVETLVNQELSGMISNRALEIQQLQNMPLMEAFQ
ncbi:PREDICTED: uncharacterized protein LOC109242257 [Nicotiana attenuata]|uniref:Uncharacterized protein n=1 Tax=Nicotiana attenuata TaxID=49451 RepID=A0A314L428_NICAT|nr:PREDICTED: uncharacterized protein LOC109242257 [Nicotiana attenuata]OIT36265.1 hypothetical protein A4A49_06726 [Nicotiana attenuata]